VLYNTFEPATSNYPEQDAVYSTVQPDLVNNEVPAKPVYKVFDNVDWASSTLYDCVSKSLPTDTSFNLENKKIVSFDECSYLIELNKHKINDEPDNSELNQLFRVARDTVKMLVEDMVVPANYSNQWYRHQRPNCTTHDIMKLLYRLRQQYLARNHAIRIFELLNQTYLFESDLVTRLLMSTEPKDLKTRQLWQQVSQHIMQLIGKALHMVTVFQKHEVYPGKVVFRGESLKG